MTTDKNPVDSFFISLCYQTGVGNARAKEPRSWPRWPPTREAKGATLSARSQEVCSEGRLVVTTPEAAANIAKTVGRLRVFTPWSDSIWIRTARRRLWILLKAAKNGMSNAEQTKNVQRTMNEEEATERDILQEVVKLKQKRRPSLSETEVSETIRNLGVLRWSHLKPSLDIPTHYEWA
jgi:hypothetical protein